MHSFSVVSRAFMSKHHYVALVYYIFCWRRNNNLSNYVSINPNLLRKLTVMIQHQLKPVSTGFEVLKVLISTLETRRSNMKNWRRYSIKTRDKRKTNFQNYCKLVAKPFIDTYMNGEWFKSKKIECHPNWSQGTWICDFSFVNSFSNDKGSLHRIVTGDKIRRKSWDKPDQTSTSTAKYMNERVCSVFGEISYEGETTALRV